MEQNLIADKVCSRPFKRWQGTELLLDGHHRLPLCLKHGIPYRVEDIALPDREAALQWILGNQLGQRNLTPARASYFRGKLYKSRKRQGQRTDLAVPTSVQNEQKLDTAEQVAASTGVSASTVRRDARYAADVDAIADTCGPEARRAILSPQADLSREDVGRIARLPAPEQQQEMKRLTGDKGAGKQRKTRKSKKAARTRDTGPREDHGERSSDPAAGASPAAPTLYQEFREHLRRAEEALALAERDWPALVGQLTAEERAEAMATVNKIADVARGLKQRVKRPAT